VTETFEILLKLQACRLRRELRRWQAIGIDWFKEERE